jgi:hypothetical protein
MLRLVAKVGMEPETFLNITLGYDCNHFYSKAFHTYAEHKRRSAEKGIYTLQRESDWGEEKNNTYITWKFTVEVTAKQRKLIYREH